MNNLLELLNQYLENPNDVNKNMRIMNSLDEIYEIHNFGKLKNFKYFEILTKIFKTSDMTNDEIRKNFIKLVKCVGLSNSVIYYIKNIQIKLTENDPLFRLFELDGFIDMVHFLIMNNTYEKNNLKIIMQRYNEYKEIKDDASQLMLLIGKIEIDYSNNSTTIISDDQIKNKLIMKKASMYLLYMDDKQIKKLVKKLTRGIEQIIFLSIMMYTISNDKEFDYIKILEMLDSKYHVKMNIIMKINKDLVNLKDLVVVTKMLESVKLDTTIKYEGENHLVIAYIEYMKILAYIVKKSNFKTLITTNNKIIINSLKLDLYNKFKYQHTDGKKCINLLSYKEMKNCFFKQWTRYSEYSKLKLFKLLWYTIEN